MSDITYPGRHGEIHAHLALPTADGPRPGVVLTLRGAAARLVGTLARLGIDQDVKEYPGVGHSFMNDHDGPMTVLMRVMGLCYAGASEDARRRILAFFYRHLQQQLT